MSNYVPDVSEARFTVNGSLTDAGFDPYPQYVTDAELNARLSVGGFSGGVGGLRILLDTDSVPYVES